MKGDASMNDRHWTIDELISRLYAVGGGDETHLASCASCRARWDGIIARRLAVTSPPPVAGERLAAQRRAVWARIDASGTNPLRLRVASGLAFAATSVIALLLSMPGPQPSREVADAQFFSEVQSMVEAVEPGAVSPIHGLFEEVQ